MEEQVTKYRVVLGIDGDDFIYAEDPCRENIAEECPMYRQSEKDYGSRNWEEARANYVLNEKPSEQFLVEED